jgi:hypothetical protein
MILGTAADYRLGIHALAVPLGPQPAGLTTLENGELYEDGSVGPARGRKVLNPDTRHDNTSDQPLAIDAGFEYITGSTRKVIVASDALYLFDRDTNDFTKLTGASNTLTIGTPGMFIQYQDTLVYGNGVDPVLTYDGSTVTALQWPTKAGVPTLRFKYFAVYAERLWFAEGDSGDDNIAQNRIYFTDAGYADTTDADTALDWYQNFFFNIGPGLKFAVTGMGVQGANLIVFKKNLIEMISGTGPGAWTKQQLHNTVGCAAGYTIAPLEGMLAWRDADHIMAYDGYDIFKLSKLIHPIIRDIEKTRIAYERAIRYRSPYSGIESYLLTCTRRKDGTKHDTVLACSIFEDRVGWNMLTGFEANTLWNTSDDNEFEEWMSGDSRGFLRQHDIDRDSEQENADFVMTTRPLAGDNPENKLDFNEGIIFYQADRPVTVDVLSTVDSDKHEGTPKEITFGVYDEDAALHAIEKVADQLSFIDRSTFKVATIPLRGYGRTIQLQLRYQGAGADFRILPIMVDADDTGGRS